MMDGALVGAGWFTCGQTVVSFATSLGFGNRVAGGRQAKEKPHFYFTREICVPNSFFFNFIIIFLKNYLCGFASLAIFSFFSAFFVV
jgi:hypothetical protein